MIQWIALAVAVDANDKAGQARNAADKARHDGSGSELVIVRPVDLIDVPSGEPTWKLFGLFTMTPKKEVLDKEPWSTFSIKKNDILNIEEFVDDDNQKYCTLTISEYAKIRRSGIEGVIIRIKIPGSIEEVAGAIGGL